jgi:Protein of unknown function (DUF3305)
MIRLCYSERERGITYLSPTWKIRMAVTSPLARFPVGVVVERRKSSSPWNDGVWRAVAVLPGVPDCAPWTELGRDGDAITFFGGTAQIELYRSETANYRGNLTSPTPSLWIVLRPTGDEPPLSIVAVTADPAEGEAFTEPGTDLVECVEMPPAVQARIAAFVAEYHVEHSFQRRERDRADLETLSRRIPFSESKTE